MKLIILWVFLYSVHSVEQKIDPNGYIIFCPCMGRFGNQIDQLLGVLSFANSLGRTLVLPNFIEYEHPKTKMIPFESIFQVQAVKKYTKIVTMNEFTKNIMPKIWPKDTRKALCWTPRQSIYDAKAEPGCHPKEGSPFGPYWDHIGVDFVGDEFFGQIPGGFDLNQLGNRQQWHEKFNPTEFPVLAFPSAPSTFPSKSKVWNIQKYLRWSARITDAAKKFISANLKTPFVAVHLRNDNDWNRVCEHIDPTRNMPLFASEQCLGEGNYLGKLTKEMCSPSEKTIVEQIVEQVGRIGAKSVFVSSDKNHMIYEINEALKPYDIIAHKLSQDDPFTSLAILGRSDVFIGNCVSTFSHVVKRERDHGSNIVKPTVYFGYSPEKRHIEL